MGRTTLFNALTAGPMLSLSFTMLLDMMYLRSVQEECGADIYLSNGVLHVHPPGEVVGVNRFYNFALNVEAVNLTYRQAADRKVRVVVKALLPDGTVKEVEVGATGGEKRRNKMSYF